MRAGQVGLVIAVSCVAGPRARAEALAPDAATDAAISVIQGEGAASPLVGRLVTTSGVVTGVRRSGFFIQTPDADRDADPVTSEGLFVYTGSTPPSAATVGNLVSVTGKVQEYVPSADPYSPPLTELSGSPTVVLLAAGRPLPEAVTITAADASPDGALDQLERYEGMRVRMEALTVVAPTAGSVDEVRADASSNGLFYGVLPGTARPFREPGIEAPEPLPAYPCCAPRFDGNPERIGVGSGWLVGSSALEVASGAVVTGVVGPLDYQSRTYTVLPEPSSPLQVSGPNGAGPPPLPGTNELTVATLNLQRFFDDIDDPAVGEPVLTAGGFQRRLRKASLLIRTVLHSPCVLGVQEVEGLPALDALARALNADAVAAGDGDPAYEAYVDEGNDPGGIDVGFLIRRDRIDVTDVVQEGKGATFEAAGQSYLLNDRPPLVLRAAVRLSRAGTFPFTVVVNHLRSRSDIEDAQKGPWVRAKRQAQAEFLATMVQARQHASPGEKIIVLGDFNAFEVNDGYADVMGTVAGTPAPADEVAVNRSTALVSPPLVNLATTVTASQRYSYVFRGTAQVLDHVLVTANLAARAIRLVYVRANADFPETLRGSDDRPERISDHDPAVAYFRLPESEPRVRRVPARSPTPPSRT